VSGRRAFSDRIMDRGAADRGKKHSRSRVGPLTAGSTALTLAGLMAEARRYPGRLDYRRGAVMTARWLAQLVATLKSSGYAGSTGFPVSS
jgi:hypothetical protein